MKRSIGAGNLPLNLLGTLGSKRINVGELSSLPVLTFSGGSARYMSALADFFGLKIETSI
jgi:hypothetical protein